MVEKNEYREILLKIMQEEGIPETSINLVMQEVDRLGKAANLFEILKEYRIPNTVVNRLVAITIRMK